MPTEQTNLEMKNEVKAWATYPVFSIRVRLDGGFIIITPQQEYNSILNELVSMELDAANIYSRIYSRLIGGFDYDPLSHERTFRYRRGPMSSNPEKINIKLQDGTPICVIVSYDF